MLDYTPYLLAILILIALSGIMSATEVAFFSLTPAEISQIAESTGKEDKRIHRLIRKPARLLAAILVANNLFNVSVIILATFMLSDIQESMHWDMKIRFVLEVVGITFLILLFGEITPKVWAANKQLEKARTLSGFTSLIYFVFQPVTWALTKSTRFLEKPLTQETEQLSRQDIRHAIDLTSDAESPDEEKEILKGIVNFYGIPVRSVFQARVDVKALEIHTHFEQLIDSINEFGYSRIPVYEETLDNIKGILYVKDLIRLLKEEGEPDWQSLVRPAYFVPESKKIDVLLDEFKEKRLHIAVVVDEYGGTAGIITLEDILEEIFGEINDEFDTEAPDWTQISESEFMFDGKILLNELIRIANLPEEIFDTLRGENDSLAGLILEINGAFPDAGDVLHVGSLRFTIESVTPQRIKKVKMETGFPDNNGA